ncbi:zinc finger protein 160-like [Contarinia nasturtii]|uniref:zinc finger protein 160-like n=1 Tax=Contarinia nasturtii TaxID=265458 RepID=UPI0012D47372|nr:zinc finger protein 160-like [Contarinia nasturtii]
MMAMLSCPLCLKSCFSSIDLLRTSLISIINRPLVCPICNDIHHSLDDLATHLTQHIEMPSQIGQSEHCDVIHNININNDNNNNNNSTMIETNSRANQFDRVELLEKCDGSMTQKLNAQSLMLPLLSPSPSSLSPSSLTATVSPVVCKFEQKSNINSAQIERIAVRPLFICNLCDCSFRSQELQQMHMQLVHEINIKCKDGKLTNARVISSTMLQCNLCPKRFKMIGSLRLHVRMVHGVSHVSSSSSLPQKIRTPNAVADTIDNSAVQSTGNNENMLGTGGAIPSSSDSTSPTHVNSTNPPLVHNNHCDYYSNYGVSNVVTFGSKSTNGGGSDDGGGGGGDNEQKYNEGLSNGNNNSKEMITSTEDRVHKCDICNKRFTTKYFLKKHKRLHTGEMPYTCELCHRTFTFQQSYHRHLSYHTNDRPHSCSICGRAFKELSTLHNHQRIHSGEKPFECETCGKCFRQRVSYLVHRRIHTGVMPYNCTMCDKKFRYKISLRTHKCSGFIVAEHKSPLNNDTTFRSNEHQPDNMSTCSQSLDELITESCNRMGIVDQTELNPSDLSTYSTAATETGDINSNTSMLHFECDSFNLNDLSFCTGETSNTDLANVMPSMDEIFPQTMEIMNALYDDMNMNNSDLQHFYDPTSQQ